MNTTLAKSRDMKVYITRSSRDLTEKSVVVPQEENMDPYSHLWAELRFITDIMSEHSLFLSLLKDGEHKKRLLEYSYRFYILYGKIDSLASFEKSFLDKFADETIAVLRAFSFYVKNESRKEYWFPDGGEADRWIKKIKFLKTDHTGTDFLEVVSFWDATMESHYRFLTYVLGGELKNYKNIVGWGKIGDIIFVLAKEPGFKRVLIQNNDTEKILKKADLVLETNNVLPKEIEQVAAKRVLDLYWEQHIRREVLKFISELRRSDF